MNNTVNREDRVGRAPVGPSDMEITLQHEPPSDRLSHLIAQEVAHALRLPRTGAHMRLLEPIVRRLTRRFAEFAVAFNADIAALGFREAVKRFSAHFIEGRTATGAETIPAAGPLIVAANHPGAADAFVIISSLPRDDAALVISDVPITRALPHAADRFIHVSGEMDSHIRAVREMTHHLQDGGTVVIFPSTNLTPDPAIATSRESYADRPARANPGALAKATFGRWSQSILLPLKRVPDCLIQPAIVSGVLHPRFAHHLLTRYIPASRSWERQLLAEILQIMHQVRTGDLLGLHPHVRFGAPVAFGELSGLNREAAMAAIVGRALPLLTTTTP